MTDTSKINMTNGTARVLPTLKALEPADVSVAFDKDKGTLALSVDFATDRAYVRPVSKKTGEQAKNELIAEVGSRFGAFELPGGYVMTFYLGKKTSDAGPSNRQRSTVKVS